VGIAPPLFTVQAVGTTLERTTIGALRAGSRVNLEPSLRIGDEIGGHLVTGHVDGICRISALRIQGDAMLLDVEVPPELAHFIAPRGSVTLDGASLTVAELSEERVRISMIPHTLANTIAGDYRIGDRVNLEVDLIARYLDRLLTARRREGNQGISLATLFEKYS
jgi:riboflavin synthase